MRIPSVESNRTSSDEHLQEVIIQLAGRDAVERMEERFDRGQRFVKEFYETLPRGSLTKRSIERADSWSETASWARREGYVEFATRLDAFTWEYNALVPPEVAE